MVQDTSSPVAAGGSAKSPSSSSKAGASSSKAGASSSKADAQVDPSKKTKSRKSVAATDAGRGPSFSSVVEGNQDKQAELTTKLIDAVGVNTDKLVKALGDFLDKVQ